MMIQINAHAFIDPTGPTQVLYLVKILEENLRRYYQLKMMIKDVRGSHNLLKKVNSGMNGAIGIMLSMPIKDQEILAKLTHYRDALRKIENIYGNIPKSKEEALQKLHDQTVSESITMISQALEYTKSQEENAKSLANQVALASPKGAQKLNVEVNSAILHSLNQLIRINGQMLKVQSEGLAMDNKDDKDHVKYLGKVNRDFTIGISKITTENYAMPRFE